MAPNGNNAKLAYSLVCEFKNSSFFFYNLCTFMRLPYIPGADRITKKDNVIHFELLALVTPNGDVRIEDMSLFEVYTVHGSHKSVGFFRLDRVFFIRFPRSILYHTRGSPLFSEVNHFTYKIIGFSPFSRSR